MSEYDDAWDDDPDDDESDWDDFDDPPEDREPWIAAATTFALAEWPGVQQRGIGWNIAPPWVLSVYFTDTSDPRGVAMGWSHVRCDVMQNPDGPKGSFVVKGEYRWYTPTARQLADYAAHWSEYAAKEVEHVRERVQQHMATIDTIGLSSADLAPAVKQLDTAITSLRAAAARYQESIEDKERGTGSTHVPGWEQ